MACGPEIKVLHPKPSVRVRPTPHRRHRILIILLQGSGAHSNNCTNLDIHLQKDILQTLLQDFRYFQTFIVRDQTLLEIRRFCKGHSLDLYLIHYLPLLFSWWFLGAFLDLFNSTKRLGPFSKFWPNTEINIQITSVSNPGVESYVGGGVVVTDQE